MALIVGKPRAVVDAMMREERVYSRKDRKLEREIAG
jgi:hypothetical protein